MALQDSIQSLQDFDLSDLDFENIGSWPHAVKVVIWALVFLLMGFVGYKLYISDLNVELESEQAKEVKLKADFVDKADKAANLDSYRDQMLEMEETFGALVRQLPSETDVPGLLEDLDHKAVSTGLEVLSIDPQPEQAAEFYVELPIEIIVKGTYHDLGSFVSGVAGLPRIVTLHDFNIERGEDNDGTLVLTITARTYRYKDEDFEADEEAEA
ncbi:MAG: type 4a pilus biogenesis protein PilO [Pseudomonadales bacterium]